MPCALGEFVGRALAAFEGMPHHREEPDPNVVSVFVQYENARNGDVSNVELEPLDPAIVADAADANDQSAVYEPCKPVPAQMLLAVERKKARMSDKEATKGFKGKKLVVKQRVKTAVTKSKTQKRK